MVLDNPRASLVSNSGRAFANGWRGNSRTKTPPSLATAADLEHSLSGNYTRGSSGAVNDCLGRARGRAGRGLGHLRRTMLTFGLMWFDRARQSLARRTCRGPALFFPRARDVSPRIACKRCRRRWRWSCTNTARKAGERGWYRRAMRERRDLACAAPRDRGDIVTGRARDRTRPATGSWRD